MCDTHNFRVGIYISIYLIPQMQIDENFSEYVEFSFTLLKIKDLIPFFAKLCMLEEWLDHLVRSDKRIPFLLPN